MLGQGDKPTMNIGPDYRVFTAVAVIMAVLILSTLFGGIFVKDQVATKCLEVQGYSNIQVLDKAWFFIPMRGGDRGDSARFHLKATNPTGQEVELYVFSGWLFKGATIRTF